MLNIDFKLDDFKFIYFWEWLHRLWARLIGVVFIIGFVYLTTKRQLKKEMVKPLLILFLLGALQGAVGWIMVASGLTGDAVYVKPARLALHFIFAIVLIAYTFWFFLKLTVPAKQRIISTRINSFTVLLIALTVIQLVFGALMAGHKAATAAPTWPDINGSMWPDTLTKGSLLTAFLENKTMIHFVHRNLAYLISILTILYTLVLNRFQGAGKIFNNLKAIPLLLVLFQVILGVFALVTSPGIQPNNWGTFEWIAQFHQVTGMLFALSLVALLYTVRRR